MAILMGFASELPDITFVAVDTPGSGSNLEYLQAGHADVALAYSDGVYRAYAEELRNGARSDAARAIAVLHPAPVHVLVRGDADVRSIADLRGRRIASGALGTGTAYTSEVLLRFFGVPNQPGQVHRLSFEQSVEALRAQQVDAAFVVSSDPVDTIRAATDRGAVLVPISGETLDQLLTDYPFFRRKYHPEPDLPQAARGRADGRG